MARTRARWPLAVLIAAAGLAAAGATRACPPERQLTVLVPYAAGGSVDVTTRIVAKFVGTKLGRSVAVTNVVGASGLLAVRKLLAAEHDGCTLLAGTVNTVVLLPLMNPRAGFSTNDLQPVGRLGGTEMVLVAGKRSGLRDVAELERAAARRSTPLRAGHPGQESLQTVALRVLQRKLQAEFVEVPYSGAAQLVTDLVGGHLDIAVLAKPVALPLVERGSLHLLTVLTASEGYPATSWSGWFAAAAVSRATIDATSQALSAVATDRATVQALAELGVVMQAEGDRASFAREVAATVRRIGEELASRPPAGEPGGASPSGR